MTAPQLENGYTQIANELLEAMIRFGFSKRELTLILALIRATYGFKKKEDDMTFQQLEGWTGIKRSHVSETLRDLSARRVVLIRDGRLSQNGTPLVNGQYVIGLNKDYRQWLSQNGTPSKCPKTGQKGVPKRDAPKKESKEISPPPIVPPQTKKRAAVKIDTFLAECREAGEKPIRPDDPVFSYADDVGIPHQFLRLAWREFVEKYRSEGKRYKDWRHHFRNCVRGNWYRLWYPSGDGSYALTTAGVQAERRNAAAEAKRNAA